VFRFTFWLTFLLLARPVAAQWSPPADLKSVPVRYDCRKTKGTIGMSFQPSLFNPHGIIFLCPDRAAAIDRISPGASIFFRVHEYGHLALGSRDEAMADAWAADQLGRTDNGKSVLLAAISYFAGVGDRFAPYYGTGFYRALNVATSGGIDRSRWPDSLLDYQQRWTDRLQHNGSIVFRTNKQFSADGLVVIDNRTLGFFDTLHPERALPLPELSEGTHRISLTDVWTYQFGTDHRLQALERGLSATASFTIQKGMDLIGSISANDTDLSLSVGPVTQARRGS
jgi:hypothetical protein